MKKLATALFILISASSLLIVAGVELHAFPQENPVHIDYIPELGSTSYLATVQVALNDSWVQSLLAGHEYGIGRNSYSIENVSHAEPGMANDTLFQQIGDTGYINATGDYWTVQVLVTGPYVNDTAKLNVTVDMAANRVVAIKTMYEDGRHTEVHAVVPPGAIWYQRCDTGIYRIWIDRKPERSAVAVSNMTLKVIKWDNDHNTYRFGVFMPYVDIPTDGLDDSFAGRFDYLLIDNYWEEGGNNRELVVDVEI